MSFVPGYISTITIDGTAVNVFSSSAGLTKTTATLDETTLGLTEMKYNKGLRDTSLEMTLHLDTVGIIALQAADDDVLPVVIVFRPGALGDKDAGSYTGDGFITDMTISGEVDSNWEVSLQLQGTGAWPYTPPV